MDFLFFLNSVLFGVGLAMDAFSVSVANGLREPDMTRPRRVGIAGLYAGFQTLMPLLGWVCVHAAAQRFAVFARFIPWIALALLLYIGIGMIREAAKPKPEDAAPAALTPRVLLLQGVATSIDALSVGFTVSALPFAEALTEALIIGGVTFGVCLVGLLLGGRLGERLTNRAGYLGGAILIGIGIEIFVKGVFF